MGAGGFHGRVRDGIGCGPPAMTTRSSNPPLSAGLSRGAAVAACPGVPPEEDRVDLVLVRLCVSCRCGVAVDHPGICDLGMISVHGVGGGYRAARAIRT